MRPVQFAVNSVSLIAVVGLITLASCTPPRPPPPPRAQCANPPPQPPACFKTAVQQRLFYNDVSNLVVQIQACAAAKCRDNHTIAEGLACAQAQAEANAWNNYLNSILNVSVNIECPQG